MKHQFKPTGVCSNHIEFVLEDGIVKSVLFKNGCDGNAQGLANLAEGRKAEDVIKALTGVRCGTKKTSCPDQLAKALQQAIDEQK